MLPMKALAAEIGEPNGVCWPRGKQKGELGGGEPSFLPFTLQRSKPTSPFPLLLGRCLLQAGGGCSPPLAPPAALKPGCPQPRMVSKEGTGAERGQSAGEGLGQRHLASQPGSLACLLKAQQQPAPRNTGSFLIMKCVYEHFSPFLACKRTERYWNRQQK